MASLYFYYGAMGSSKTANALMARYNYLEKGQKVLLLRPAIDTRFGSNVVKSRIGLSEKCVLVEDFLKGFHAHYPNFKQDMLSNRAEKYQKFDYAAIIIDEAQFMTEEQVEFLSDIVDFLDIPVLCYGLRIDFQNHLFPGSAKLLAIADKIQEIKTVCWCGKKAVCNARYNQNGIVREGNQIEIGENDRYVSLCRKHFKLGQIEDPRGESDV